MVREEAFQIEPVDATFGAVVTGLKVNALDDATFSELYEAWLEYALLIFPQQHLTRSEQIAFTERFGDLEVDVPISNVKPDGSVCAADEPMGKALETARFWHCDNSYLSVQAKAIVFSSHILPAAETQTGFADMRAAYEALDEATRARLAGLSAYHAPHKATEALRGGHDVLGEAESEFAQSVPSDPPLRPLVVHHPETGRASLLIGAHAYRIPGMDAAAAERLLQGLVDDACQSPRIYHHTWTLGDVVVWDNRCLLHRAVPWDLAEPRAMHLTAAAQ